MAKPWGDRFIYSNRFNRLNNYLFEADEKMNHKNICRIGTLSVLILIVIMFFPHSVSATINFTDPTPQNGSTQNVNSIYANLSTVISGNHYAFVDFNGDLVSWMQMDNVNSSGDPTDSSSYSRNASKKGDANQTASGNFGKGFFFDGVGDYIKIPEANYANSAYTVSVWANTRNLSGTQTIWDMNNWDSHIEIKPNGTIYFLAYNVPSAFASAYGQVVGINTWHHYVIISNTTHMLFYVDGVG
jgi:hypothetical protein